jgi:hypothetical protein
MSATIPAPEMLSLGHIGRLMSDALLSGAVADMPLALLAACAYAPRSLSELSDSEAWELTMQLGRHIAALRGAASPVTL